MLKSILIACSLMILFVSNGLAQDPVMITDEKLFGKDCYYLELKPERTVVKGVLVLVPGYGEHPFSVNAQTSILQEAIKKDLAVMIVCLSPKNDKFTINQEATDK